MSATGLAVAVLALVVSILSALSSRRSARRSATAAESSAAEAKRANDVQEAERAAQGAEWGAPELVAGSKYRIRNVGRVTAFEATIVGEVGGVHPDLSEPRDIEPRDVMTFVAMRLGSQPCRLRIEWRGSAGEERVAHRQV